MATTRDPGRAGDTAGGRTLGWGARAQLVIRRCGHPFPIVVEGFGEGRTARCLRCGRRGPVRAGAREALRALQDEEHEAGG